MRVIFCYHQKIYPCLHYSITHRLIAANVYKSYIPTIFVTWHDDKIATGCYNRRGARRKES